MIIAVLCRYIWKVDNAFVLQCASLRVCGQGGYCVCVHQCACHSLTRFACVSQASASGPAAHKPAHAQVLRARVVCGSHICLEHNICMKPARSQPPRCTAGHLVTSTSASTSASHGRADCAHWEAPHMHHVPVQREPSFQNSFFA